METIVMVALVGGSLGIIGLIMWLAWWWNYRSKSSTHGIVINIASQFSHGRAIGGQIATKRVTGGRQKIMMLPRDVSPSKNPEGQQEIHPESYLVGRNKRIVFPIGTWSQDENIIMDLPPTAADFPEGWKHTPIGRLLMFYTEAINAENTEVEALRIGSQRKTDILKNMGDGEISREQVTQLKDLLGDFLDAVKEAKGEKKTSSFNEPQRPSSF